MADDPTAVSVDSEQAESSSHGHRQLDDIWDHYKKIRLTIEEHDKWHRWYDARCKYCGVRHAGKRINLDIDFDHPALSNPGRGSAAAPIRAEVGSGKAECDVESLIATE